ncbi:hypothetical protein JNM05_07220 [bacterium]|nr:hypothetical protein [bacterium]
MLKHLKSNRPVDNNFAGHGDNSCLKEEDIIRYLFHEITDEERFQIENHFTECDLCYDLVSGARKFDSEEELRIQIEHTRREIRKKFHRSAPALRGSKLAYYAAAALVLIAFSGFSYWMSHDPNRQLADEYLKPYSNTIPLSRSQSQETLLEEAMAAYDLEHYAVAEAKLSEFIAQNPDNLTAHLYCGISGLMSGDARESLTRLQKAANSQETRIADAAEWYLALANLKLGHINDAKTILVRVVNKNGYFTNSARSLLERIDNP